MLKVKSFLKEALIIAIVFVLLFLENTLPLLKGASFLKNLPFLTIFLFVFFFKSPFVFFLAFLAGAFLDFYSPLPLFSFAFLFLILSFLIKYLQKIFQDYSFWSFFISFLLGFLTFRLLALFSLSSLKVYFNSFLNDFIFSLILIGPTFSIVKYYKRISHS